MTLKLCFLNFDKSAWQISVRQKIIYCFVKNKNDCLDNTRGTCSGFLSNFGGYYRSNLLKESFVTDFICLRLPTMTCGMVNGMSEREEMLEMKRSTLISCTLTLRLTTLGKWFVPLEWMATVDSRNPVCNFLLQQDFRIRNMVESISLRNIWKRFYKI